MQVGAGWHGLVVHLFHTLNQSQDGIGMRLVLRYGGRRGELIGLRVQCGAATLHDLVGSTGQTTEELVDLLPHGGGGAQASIGGNLIAHPIPDCLIGIEVRTVGRQPDQPQAQVRCAQ
jgi:hypothetical protein